MKRTFERKMMYAACGWQMLTGMVTIFGYSFYIKSQESQFRNLSVFDQKGIHSIFDNLYTFTITFGMLFVVIACVNALLIWKVVKDDSLQYKMPLFWIGLAILFFFLKDFISIALCMASAVIALSKNKAIKHMASRHRERIDVS